MTYQVKLEELHEMGFSNEVLLQKVAAWDTSSAVTSFGYGIMAELGIWDFMGNQNNWPSPSNIHESTICIASLPRFQ